ncbi:MAG: hypothetical protein ACJAXW_003200 [Candidatus Azotimanducaceae bacterium]|jgi:hypothetical protein
MLSDNNLFSSRLLVMISTLQGGLLLGLYRLEEHKVWSDGTDLYSLPLWAAAIIFPFMLLLALEKDNVRSLLKYVAGFTLCVMLLAAYLGTQLTPGDGYQGGALIWVFTLAMVIAGFKAIMYIQQRVSTLPFSYSVFFSLSWRNFLVTFLALLFMAAVSLLLLLWRSLFSAIGIEFFDYLFQRDWFLFPLFGFSFGLGVVIFRELSAVIDSIARLLQGLLRLLLPVLTLLSLSFLLSLLFVGLEVLWNTNVGTSLMLWLLASMLFFLNAVYQDGRGDTAYSSGMHWFVSAGLMTLPVLSVLALSGLLMRIAQHGFTVPRLYGLTVWLALSVFAVCYLWALMKKRAEWTTLLGPINIRIGLALLVTVLVISSPIIDFRKITLANQLARFESGEVKIDDLDVRYFRQDLGAPGYEAYETLVAEYETIQPDLVANWKMDYSRRGLQIESVDIDQWLVKHPASLELPDAIKTLLQRQFLGRVGQVIQGSSRQGNSLRAMIFQQDLNGDAIEEFVVLSHGGMLNQNTALYFQNIKGAWHSGHLVSSEPTDYARLLPQIQRDEIKLLRPEHSDLEIGGVRFRVQARIIALSGGPFTTSDGVTRTVASPPVTP